MYDFNKVTIDAKPLSEFDEIYRSLKSLLILKTAAPGKKFSMHVNNKRMCFILFEGTCVVKRSSDSLILSTMHAPGIVGLQDIFHARSDVQVSAISEIEYGFIEAEQIFAYAEQYHLWKNICYMLMLSSTRFTEYQRETVGISNYELICNFLNSLNQESFEIRATTTALDYIQGRCFLSRSGILKTLASLKQGGYIVINKGLLVRINSLPKKF